MKVVGQVVYSVVEIYNEEDTYYEYYLRKEGYGDLHFLYGSASPCEPIEIGQYVRDAEDTMNWE